MIQKINILMVEDVEFTRDLLRSAVRSCIDDHELPLEPTFFNTSIGRDVLSIIKHKNINLVYLDIDLPDASGLEILKKIKAQFKYVQVVMVSGENSSANVMDAIKSGTSGFIVKPFNSARISDSLRNYLKAEPREYHDEVEVDLEVKAEVNVEKDNEKKHEQELTKSAEPIPMQEPVKENAKK